jgi:hypothetical protein
MRPVGITINATQLIKDMARKKKNYYIDERAIALLADLAKKEGVSQNQFVETLVILYGKLIGRFPLDFEELPEGRGGDRTTTSTPKPSKDPQQQDATP